MECGICRYERVQGFISVFVGGRGWGISEVVGYDIERQSELLVLGMSAIPDAFEAQTWLP